MKGWVAGRESGCGSEGGEGGGRRGRGGREGRLTLLLRKHGERDSETVARQAAGRGSVREARCDCAIRQTSVRGSTDRHDRQAGQTGRRRQARSAGTMGGGEGDGGGSAHNGECALLLWSLLCV